MKKQKKSFFYNTNSILVGMVILVFFLLTASLIQGKNITSAGTGNWSATAWPNTSRTGNITTSTSSAAVTGTSTKFLTEISVGNIIKTTTNVVIGTVLSVTDDTHLTLTAKAASKNTAIAYNSQGVGSGDAVTINKSYTVTVDVSNASCLNLTIQRDPAGAVGSTTLNFNANQQLSVTGIVTLNSASTNKTANLDMTNGGTLICQGVAANTYSVFIPGKGTVVLTANNTLPSIIFTTFNNLTINGGTTTASIALNITGDITITSGTFAAGSFSHIVKVGSKNSFFRF